MYKRKRERKSSTCVTEREGKEHSVCVRERECACVAIELHYNMASLSHPQPTDFHTHKGSSNTTTTSNITHHMQGLYSLMQTLHPKYPQAAAAPPSYHADLYTMNAAKPFYYGSSVRRMSSAIGCSNIGIEVEEPSFLSTVTSTFMDDQVSSQLHHSHKQAAMESKNALSGASSLLGEELHLNAAKKRIRAVMDCKDADTKKRTKLSTSEAHQHRKTNVAADVKPTITNADKLKAFSPLKQNSIAEQKSPESKSNITKASSSTLDEESPSKSDYIHVRARRGQATDSHSLAERVRREKISERMKYLQDLVPSCIKVTGKAMMLDEIINYVQSLQRQVEFLSMKLAAVPPSRLEFSFDDLFGKKVAPPISTVNVPNTSTLGSNMAVPATFTPPTNYTNNVQSGFVNSILRSNEMFPESVLRSHDMNSSMACSAADQFFANLPSDLGVEDPLVHHTSAAGSSSCSLVASPTNAMLDPVQQSCISQISQLELEWDDDLHNIVQQMGCFHSQANANSWLPSDNLLTEGFFLQGNAKEEL